MFFTVYCLLGLFTTAETFLLPITRPLPHVSSDPSQPLMLTPYLEAGQINQAQHLCRVTSIKGLHRLSYSGYITVNKTYNSNLFFWFFPAKINRRQAPVILYLDGGPGYSSLAAIFLQSGPVTFDDNIALVPVNATWTEKYSVLYVDNPVGTGYSFTENDAGYASTEDDVARDMYSFLLQFLQIFHQYSSNDFYFAGESYAGKYLPALGYKVHTENPHAQLKISMKGFFMISAFSDPISVFPHYAKLLFYVGMLSEKERDIIQNSTDKAVNLIKQNKYAEAVQVFNDVFIGNVSNNTRTSLFHKFTGSRHTGNFLKIGGKGLDEKTFGYVNRTEIRLAIHVGRKPFNSLTKVFDHLQGDFLKSVKPLVTVLMDNYKVMYLNGQLDIIVNTPGTEAFLMTVPWKELDRYKNAEKIVWKVNPNDTEPAGYIRQVDSFYQVVVRNAGHTVSGDQRERCYDLLQRFIEDRPFTS